MSLDLTCQTNAPAPAPARAAALPARDQGPQSLSEVESRPREVTLFEDRAEVLRTAELLTRPGIRWIALGGVSPFLDERSLQARLVCQASSQAPTTGADTALAIAAPPARVIAARVRWRAHPVAALGREEIDALERQAEAARRAAAVAQEMQARARQDEQRLAGLLAQHGQALAQAPPGIARPELRDAWRSAGQSLERAAAAALARQAEGEREQARADLALARAELRLSEGAAAALRYEALIEVQLEAQAVVPATLEVRYRVPCALWRPEHLARLSQESGGQGEGTLELSTWATAWQRTGELWDDVEVVFSTARPARAASPPSLRDDLLTTRRKSDAERRKVVVEARDQAVALAGLDRGKRAVDEMPGVDDGGEPACYRPRTRVSLPSDGRPFRVEVERVTLPARVERVLFPERAPAAHLRATATLSSGGPLLAGPVRVARGASLVGRAKIEYVGRGEPFELGFGVDDGIRVRRTQSEKRDSVPVIGTQIVRRTVRDFLSNLSDQPRRVLVTERVPVSEIEGVEISLADAKEWKLDAKDGFATRELELAPQATCELTLGYEIRAAAKVVLPF